MTITTPGLAEALTAVARLSDDELLACLIGGQAQHQQASEAGEAVAAQAAAFYLDLALVEIERRCLSI